MTRARRIMLEGDEHDAIRMLSDRILLADGKRDTVITITRTGKFYDPRYGEFEITRDMLQSMVKNFEAGVVGQEIALDVAHNTTNGAAGYFRKLFLDGDKLRGKIELTDYGVQAIRERGFRYVSADYHENFEDNEQRAKHGATLLGAGLTIRPVIKRLDPIQLSEDSLTDKPTLISDRIKRLLLQEHANMNELLKNLLEKLSALKLADGVIKQLSTAFEAAAKPLGDEKLQREILQHFITTGETLAKTLGDAGDKTVKLDFSGLEAALKGATAGGGKALSEDDVKRILADADTARQKQAKEKADKRGLNVKLFNDLLGAAEGLKSLSEDTRKTLAQAADLITEDLTEDQVKKLAENQIAIGNKIAVQAQLAARGFAGPAGSVRITLDESNSVKKLQETIDKRLGLADMPEARRYARTGGRLQDENKKLVEMVLAEFDDRKGTQLASEHKMLAGGDGKVSDVAVPAIFERTVIREALYSLIGLQFVDSGTLAFASSALIPYSYRDNTAAGRGNTRVYEGGPIPRAGVIQASDTAYPIPQKLAFAVSDELRYLTSNGQLNWDSVAENQRNATRIIGEDLEKLIFDEVLNASDQFSVASATDQAVATADGTKTIFVLDNFPVVRPKKIYDLQGNQIGSTLYPVTVKTNGVERAEYNGTGTQAAGLYYTMNFNLGEISFVNELGVPTAPTTAHAIVCSYTWTTNVYAFNTDLGAAKADEHWDTFLYRYGLRKAVIEDERFYSANFGLMSGTVMTQIEQARQFGANSMRSGTDLQTDGNLGRVKNVPNFKSTAPGLNLGDLRVVIGERGQTRFRMMKPWSMGQLENQKDANGQFTGKKEAYGDQFVVLHTPIPLKGAQTSIVLYSAAARVDR